MRLTAKQQKLLKEIYQTGHYESQRQALDIAIHFLWSFTVRLKRVLVYFPVGRALHTYALVPKKEKEA